MIQEVIIAEASDANNLERVIEKKLLARKNPRILSANTSIAVGDTTRDVRLVCTIILETSK